VSHAAVKYSIILIYIFIGKRLYGGLLFLIIMYKGVMIFFCFVWKGVEYATSNSSYYDYYECKDHVRLRYDSHLSQALDLGQE
jgi:hypothetical protein